MRARPNAPDPTRPTQRARVRIRPPETYPAPVHMVPAGSISIRVVRATASLMDGVRRIQRACYPPELVESADVFSAILAHDMSLAAIDDDGAVIGYLLAHPDVDSIAPPLLHCQPEPVGGGAHNNNGGAHNNNGGAHNNNGGAFFLHDLSVSPEHRSRGVAAALLRAYLAQHPAGRVRLVAVNDAEPFWHKYGFRAQSCLLGVDDAARMRANYGCRCTLMTLPRRVSTAACACPSAQTAPS
jgi:GNAT superfamily N-acetyltransferase